MTAALTGLAARVRLVDGPHHGRRESGYILRGRLACKGGVYEHVEGGEDQCLYWVPNPIIVNAGVQMSTIDRPARRRDESVLRYVKEGKLTRKTITPTHVGKDEKAGGA